VQVIDVAKNRSKRFEVPIKRLDAAFVHFQVFIVCSKGENTICIIFYGQDRLDSGVVVAEDKKKVLLV
jgi:DNA/RNA-binding domain of Phe-tRNA-synthetase-like protein